MDNRARAASVPGMGVEGVPALHTAEAARPWWERRWFLVAVVLATMVPLIYPQIPPLVDLPGHIGRYRVELDLHHSPSLQRYFGFHWAIMGNLGLDLLIVPLAPIIGLEPAVKLIILLIPPATAIGLLWVAREIHGRVPPTALFALPFIYGFPFLFGFANYTLSAALSFLALGLWLRLGRLERIRLRSGLFVPISLIVFLAHGYGWGLLGLMCFSTEAVRLHDRGRGWFRAVAAAALYSATMALPLLVTLAWPGERHDIANGWFDWGAKWIGAYSTLRDRWGPFDVSSVELACVIFLFAIISPKLTLSRGLALTGLLLGTAFLVLPRYVLDSAYSDARLLPYLFALALLSIRVREPADARLGQFLAVLGLAFFAARIGGTTASFAIAANDQQARLHAIDVVPRGARVVVLYGLPTAEPWALPRDSHLGGLVIDRREGFSNDQWITANLNMLELRYRDADGFALNPSQIVRPNGEHDAIYRTIDEALKLIPRDKFDYIWLIDVPPFDYRLLGGLTPVWSDPRTTLYRVQPGAGEH
jgi:hypothetical protein